MALLSKFPAMSHESAMVGRWLAALMACLAVPLNIPLLQELGLWLHWPRLLVVLSGLPLLFGPLLFAHVATHTHQQVYLQRPFLYRHLVLPVLFYLLMLPQLGRESSELQQMLASPTPDAARFSLIPALRHQSILDIALICGFYNKKTFNKAFKAQTGETPSAWRHLHTDG